jgi:hypothetical protein
VGKTADQQIERAKHDIAAVVNRFTSMAFKAVEDLTDEQIKEGFAKPSVEAPVWTKLVDRVVAAAARSETERPTVRQSLNLIMVGRAESTDKWLESVRAEQAEQRQLEAIDVAPVEVKK